MRRTAALLSLAAVIAAPALAQQPPASQETISAYVTAAERAAGADLRALLVLCKPAPAARPSQDLVDKLIAQQIARSAPAPGRAFDNLYFVGGAWASAWAIRTSEGVLLLDALNNPEEAERLIDRGMRTVGLDPARIRAVLVSHAHGDHYGGMDHLARYRPAVVLSEIDWQQLEGKLEFDSPHWGRPPKFDAARGDRRSKDGERLVIGDTAVTMYVTPGHTLGTITPVFDLADGTRKHRAMLWGGTAFNFGRDVPRLQAYIDATERMARVAKEQGIDVMISNHAGYDGTIDKLAAIAKGAAANPFVIGNDAVVRGLQVMGECAKAQRDRFILEK